jgi:hypothetical protein
LVIDMGAAPDAEGAGCAQTAPAMTKQTIAKLAMNFRTRSSVDTPSRYYQKTKTANAFSHLRVLGERIGVKGLGPAIAV